MNHAEYIESHNKLMEKWIERHRRGRDNFGFVKDGIINPEIWFAREDNERILFLLKEAYEKDEEKHIWDLPSWIRETKCMDSCDKECKGCFRAGNAYTRLAEWVWGIDEFCKTRSKKFDNNLGIMPYKREMYKNKRVEMLCKASIINIKKSDGVKSSSYKNLMKYVKDDADLLGEQIAIINPTVIICGGTSELLSNIFSNISNDYKIISIPHPTQRKLSAEAMFNSVMESYESLLMKMR